jgi:hypothetical protein
MAKNEIKIAAMMWPANGKRKGNGDAEEPFPDAVSRSSSKRYRSSWRRTVY